MTRPDRYTTTEAGAAAWERRYGPVYDDDRPNPSDLADDDHEGWCDPDPDCTCRLNLLVGDDAPWQGGVA